MRKKIRKTLSVSLALLLTVCMLPLNVLAEGLQDVGENQNAEVIESQIPAGDEIGEEQDVTDRIVAEEDDLDEADLEEGDAEEIADEADSEAKDTDEEDAEAEDTDAEDAEAEETDTEEADGEEADTEEADADESKVVDGNDKQAKKNPSPDQDELALINNGEVDEITDVIEWIAAGDFTLQAGETSFRPKWDDEDLEWEAYDTMPRDFTVKFVGQDDPVHYEGGFVEFFDWFFPEYQEQMAIDFNMIGDDQSPDYLWQAGTEHEITFQLGSLTTEPYKVTILASPVKSVHINDVNRFEGQLDRYEEDIEGEKLIWYGYRMSPDYMEVELEDDVAAELGLENNVISGEEWQVREELERFFGNGIRFYSYCVEGDVQGPEELWEVGTHNMIMRVMDKEYTYHVNVLENPIQSIEVDNMRFFDNELETRDWYEDETGEWHQMDDGKTFPTYRTYPNHIKVVTTVGTFESVNGDVNKVREDLAAALELDERFFDFGEHCDQRPDNLWGVGEHEVTFRILGKETTYKVIVEANPIISIEVGDIIDLEGDYEDDRWYEDETGEGHELPNDDFPEMFSYQRYHTYPDYVKIVTTMGEFESENGDVNYVREQLAKALGIDLDKDPFDFGEHSNQSPTNKWGVGEHTAYFRVLGISGEYKITVVKNPIKKVEVDNYNILEGDTENRDSYRVEDEYGGHDVFTDYPAYRTWPTNFRVYTSDTDFEEGSDIDAILNKIAEKNELDPRVLDRKWVDGDDQTPDNTWKKGEKHILQFNLCGNKADFTVEIIENPIEFITVEPFDIVEGDKQQREWRERNPETGEETVQQFDAYNTYPGEITIKMLEEEEPLKADPNYIRDELAKELGCDIRTECWDDQSPGNNWNPGEHDVLFILGGVSAEYKVNIVSNPIAEIRFPNTLYIMENDTYKEHNYWDEDGYHHYEDGFDRYSTFPQYMEVDISNGVHKPPTVIQGNPDDVMDKVAEIMGVDRGSLHLDIHDDQKPDELLENGAYKFDVSFAGKTAQMNVEILPFPVASVEVSDVYLYHDETTTYFGYFNESGEWIKIPEGFEGYDDMPAGIKVTLKDGTVLETDAERGIWEVANDVSKRIKEGDSIVFEVHPESLPAQTPDKKWSPGVHNARLYFGNAFYDYKVIVMTDIGDFTGLIKADDTSIQYYEGGFPDRTYTGLVPGPVYATYDGRDEEKCVPIDDAFGLWYVDKGIVDLTENAPQFAVVAADDRETIYKLKDGKWDAGFEGFLKYNDKLRFFENGQNTTSTGWKSYDKNWYYLDTDGYAHIGWVKDNEKWYYMNESGVMQSGWLKLNNNWYYLESAMQTGWKKINGIWYYFESSGAMQTGWKKINGIWYYFGTSGAMQTGWKQVSGTWYYFQSSGAMQTGWLQDKGQWYYFQTSGAMQTGWLQDKGQWYYFQSSGAMQKGWLKSGGTWYYLSTSGAMKTGWLQLNKQWYYFNTDGTMVTGSKKIGNKVYKFNSSGVCLNP